MPDLTTYSEDKPIKLLFIGDSGTGKTGALASLVQAGYKLRILDFDNGLDYLVKHLVKLNVPKLLSNVNYVTCTDKYKIAGGMPIVSGTPKAFSNSLQLLTEWKEPDGPNLGVPASWARDTILVIDSLTFLSKACFNYTLALNGRLTAQPFQSDYGEAQRKIENLLAMLYSDAMNCHVIVTSHVSFVEGEGGLTKGYPSSIGKALSPQIPRYFNNMLQAKIKGSGTMAKRTIVTQPAGMVEVKVALPKDSIPAELPLDSGLRTFFKAIVGSEPIDGEVIS